MNKKVNLIDLDLVIHFRIATQGVINTGNCHPFPVSDSVEDLKSNSIKTPVGIAHNGSISFCEYKSKLKVEAELSDTQIFILRYLSQLPREILFNRTIVSLIEEATQSKFVLMSPKRTVLIGEFLKDKGVYYSNRSYLEYYWIDKYWCSYCGNYTQGFEYMDDWLCEDCCMVLSDELNIELF